MADILYCSHGGGPLPLLGDPGHDAMVKFMQSISASLKKPKAILVVSAHWEAAVATIMAAEHPSMLYDYYGFPPESYKFSYPAPGTTQLAESLARQLESKGIKAQLDKKRGYDHGLFVPLMLMYPKAEIPCLQLSQLSSLDPAQHLALGKAVGEWAEREDVLIIGSGFSFHNMSAFDFSGSNRPDSRNDSFQDWLLDACKGTRPVQEREEKLIAWAKAPAARYCHPREEHLLPLHVCAGAAGSREAKAVFDDYIVGKRSLAFLWS